MVEYKYQGRKTQQTRKDTQHMPKYIVIYHVLTEWPLSGPESLTHMQTFDDVEDARSWMRTYMDAFCECDEIHLYEYTGIQYVLIERRTH